MTRDKYNDEVCYILNDLDKQILMTGYKKEVIKLEKKIEKVRNHPKNEGQSTFLQQISMLKWELKDINESIEELSK